MASFVESRWYLHFSLAGVSRSVTITAAYILTVTNLNHQVSIFININFKDIPDYIAVFNLIMIILKVMLAFTGSSSSGPVGEGDGQPERGLPPPDGRISARRTRKGIKQYHLLNPLYLFLKMRRFIERKWLNLASMQIHGPKILFPPSRPRPWLSLWRAQICIRMTFLHTRSAAKAEREKESAGVTQVRLPANYKT